MEWSKSFVSTSKHLAMATKSSRLGWVVFVHHLDMVASFLPNCAASQRFVRFFSANTIFNLLISFFICVPLLSFYMLSSKLFSHCRFQYFPNVQVLIVLIREVLFGCVRQKHGYYSNPILRNSHCVD